MLDFNLHRTRPKADWEYADVSRRNRWQRTAAASHGWVAPANFISIGGAIIAITGLLVLLSDVSWLGIILLAIGRLADLADGYVAEATATKSPLGERIDASVDKAVIFIAMICLGIGQLVPWWVIIALGSQSIFNATLSSVAQTTRGHMIQPTRNGKLSTAAAWIVLTAFPAHNILNNYPDAQNVLSGIIIVSFLLFVISGARASYEYYCQFSKLKR